MMNCFSQEIDLEHLYNEDIEILRIVVRKKIHRKSFSNGTRAIVLTLYVCHECSVCMCVWENTNLLPSIPLFIRFVVQHTKQLRGERADTCMAERYADIFVRGGGKEFIGRYWFNTTLYLVCRGPKYH